MSSRSLVPLLVLAIASPLEAQTVARLDAPAPILGAPVRPAPPAQEPGPGWTPLRVAKWSTLGGAAGAAIYGFLKSGEADDAYDALERACEADPASCARRTPDGAYEDAALEAQYREVQRLDGRARTALIAGQVGLAASVVLFLLDLANESRPPDIPYSPPGVRVGPAGSAMEVGVRLPLGRQPTS